MLAMVQLSEIGMQKTLKLVHIISEENTWDNATTCEKIDGTCELIRRDEILKALRRMKKGKAASPTGIVLEMFMVDEDCSMVWLTSLCNLIVAQGRIVIFCYQFSKEKEIQWNMGLTERKSY